MQSSIVAIEELAHTQMGRFSRSQVAGLDARGRVLVQSQLRAHKWRRETSRVLSLPGAPRSRRGSMWTAVLHLGPTSALSHFSSARLHGLPVADDQPDSVILPAGANRSVPGFTVHQRTDLVDGHLTTVRRLRCTNVERTLFDLGGMVSASRMDAWLDQLTAERRVDPVEVAMLVQQLRRQGKHSVPALVHSLSRRLGGAGLAQGALEVRLLEAVRRAGLPDGVAQFPHPGRPDGGEFVDRAWPEARLIVEADGRVWHDRIQAASTDARRDRAAAAAGFLTIRLRHEDLVGDQAGTAIELAEIYRRRVRDVA